MTVDIYEPTGQDNLSLQELELYHQITDYRESLGLDAIRLSASLTLTAGRHVVDTRENIWAAGRDLPDGANLHSWSDARYMADGSTPGAMWNAPRRLGTDYPGNGYEITGAGYATSAEALQGWKESAGHNAILTNQDAWASIEWQAIGVGLDRSAGAGEYAGRVYHVWFGAETDPSGPPTILGTSGDDKVTVTAFADILRAGNGEDTIDGGRGDDRLSGEAGDDRLVGGRGDDRLSGGKGSDTLVGGSGDDTLLGGQNADRLSGASGDDRLFGGHGSDTLSGGAGDDALTGGSGADLLTGGPGADTFVFSAAGDSRPSFADTITDFHRGEDRLDLSGIDANTGRSGHQGFDFISGAAFSDTAGELRLAHGALQGDIDGDGHAELRIEFSEGTPREADLIL